MVLLTREVHIMVGWLAALGDSLLDVRDGE